ncbi:hypothetical protein DFJ74DRAFT_640392 [Hyaloraphidium curvatum]|nr:hypothetical protein DFJ74DRAFT_640392 [Hyaloraphidium curvatum]
MGSPPPRRASLAAARARALPFAVPPLAASGPRPLAYPPAVLAREGSDETCAGEVETGVGGRGCGHAPGPEGPGTEEAPCWWCVLRGAEAVAGWAEQCSREAEEADGTLGRTPEVPAGMDGVGRPAPLPASPATNRKRGAHGAGTTGALPGQHAVPDDEVTLTRDRGARRALAMELENMLDTTLTMLRAQDPEETGWAPSFPDLRAFWGASWIYSLGAGRGRGPVAMAPAGSGPAGRVGHEGLR